MSEQDAQGQEQKQSKIKDKLKNMGVMRDDNAGPKDKTPSLWRSKLGLVILLAIGAWALLSWMAKTSTDQTTSRPTQPTAGTQPSPYAFNGPGMAPSVPPPMPGQHGRQPEHGATHEGPMEWTATDHWGGPQTRDRDPYGPPPGWDGPMPYGPYGGYPPPPPPPPYYGYGPYYGPPPGYGYPYDGYYPYPPSLPPQAQE